MMDLKNTGRYFELTQRMKEIVHMDLRMVDISDFVIVYLDPASRPFGTIHELLNSLHQRKPTLVVVEGGRANASNWLFGIMNYNEFMFDIRVSQLASVKLTTARLKATFSLGLHGCGRQQGKTNTKSKGSARKTRRYDSEADADVDAVVDEAQKSSLLKDSIRNL